MPIPPDLKRDSARRIRLWRKGVRTGLTDPEMKEYRRLHRRVMRYIRSTSTPTEWAAILWLQRRQRRRVKRIS